MLERGGPGALEIAERPPRVVEDAIGDHRLAVRALDEARLLAPLDDVDQLAGKGKDATAGVLAVGQRDRAAREPTVCRGQGWSRPASISSPGAAAISAKTHQGRASTRHF